MRMIDKKITPGTHFGYVHRSFFYGVSGILYPAGLEFLLLLHAVSKV